ncbi:hypothetical protein [Zymobacter palmae]|uniref:Uncharacterized protein n=1 Tax=Zymobacter palmae TaxID=33074 RepID=A0A348HGF6_9GAMM|nr:hypothetical protein [Zymobacter palmae]BBG30708.1 hypothetical protein ZBT109_1962 [Zymobacter palmae]
MSKTIDMRMWAMVARVMRGRDQSELPPLSPPLSPPPQSLLPLS